MIRSILTVLILGFLVSGFTCSKETPQEAPAQPAEMLTEPAAEGTDVAPAGEGVDAGAAAGTEVSPETSTEGSPSEQ